MTMSARLRIASYLGALLIRIIGCTWRFRVIGGEHFDEVQRLARGAIFIFWHGRMLPLSYGYRNRSIHVLASEHRDGELMGQIIRRLGFGHVRGSSTRGGARAIRELADKLDEGFDLGITVDGPKGPRYEVKPGPFEIAKISGAPVVPVTTGSKRHWVFRSWDAFELPKPFTRVFVRFATPVVVPPDAGPEELESTRAEVERVLREITDANDRQAASS
jgi:lysophospholipid acyltransferase (LPLAT)-like uncharacterized protein